MLLSSMKLNLFEIARLYAPPQILDSQQLPHSLNRAVSILLNPNHFLTLYKTSGVYPCSSQSETRRSLVAPALPPRTAPTDSNLRRALWSSTGDKMVLSHGS